jgi:hypothetical protein
LGESAESLGAISVSELSDFSDSRFQWVMNFDAFQANTKPFGVCSRHARTASSEGVR